MSHFQLSESPYGPHFRMVVHLSVMVRTKKKKIIWFAPLLIRQVHRTARSRLFLSNDVSYLADWQIPGRSP